MNTVSQIQSAINSKKPISFWYSYSHPDTNRVVEPINLTNSSLLAIENGFTKRFSLDGINLVSTSSEVPTPSVETTIKQMINSNATMVFKYLVSKPEKVRYASPMGIEGDCVLTVEADTGKYKRFKLANIQFVDEAKPEEQREDEIKKRLQKALDNKEIIKIRYAYSQPDLERIVVPWSLGEYKLNLNERGVFKSFLLSGIQIVEPKNDLDEIREVPNKKQHSYTEMITSAIKSLNHRDGCSKLAIKQYISNNFDMTVSDRHLRAALSKGIDAGIFIQNSQCFSLPSYIKPSNELEQKIQKYIDYKETMTFTYNFSKPDLVRTFVPEKIRNHIVIGKQLDGRYKSFSISGINLVERELEDSATTGVYIPTTVPAVERVKQEIKKVLTTSKQIYFRYTNSSNPDKVRVLDIEKLNDNSVQGFEGGVFKKFLLQHIIFCDSPYEEVEEENTSILNRRIKIYFPYDIEEIGYVFNIVDNIAYIELQPECNQIRLPLDELDYELLPHSKEYHHFEKIVNKTIKFRHTRLNIQVSLKVLKVEESCMEDVVVVHGKVGDNKVTILSDEIEDFVIV
jgi:hypothetical protein